MEHRPETIETFLALDAASRQSSVAVAHRGDVEVVLAGQDGAPEDLLAAVDHCLRSAGLPLREVGALLCTSGPGSFTGIRVGLATATGLAESLELPAAAVTCHLAQAWWAAASPDIGPTVLSVLPSHGARYSTQAFSLTGSEIRADGAIGTREDLRGVGLTTVSPEPLSDAGSSSERHLVSPPLARVLCCMGARHPPPAAWDQPGRCGPLLWDGDLLRPVYAHSPAVAFRPRATAGPRSPQS